MEKNYKVNDDLTLEMDGKTYRLTKNNLENCGHCPLHKIQGCGELCGAAYHKAAVTPSFEYKDAIFVEVTENKETTMEEKEPNYKALYEQEHKKYGDAVERMKSWMNGDHPECFSEAHKAAEFVFPELREDSDERIRKYIMDIVKGHCDGSVEYKKCIAWLEKHKEPKPQPKQEWSEEDEVMINSIIKNLDEGEWFDILQADWLKSLKERMQPQTKQEWSEKDYNEIETIACHLDNIGNEGMAEVLRSIIDKYWLKSLKDRMTWRPTEEQMEALADAIESYCGTCRSTLNSLYNDLKKL